MQGREGRKKKKYEVKGFGFKVLEVIMLIVM